MHPNGEIMNPPALVEIPDMMLSKTPGFVIREKTGTGITSNACCAKHGGASLMKSAADRRGRRNRPLAEKQSEAKEKGPVTKEEQQC